MQMWPLPFVRFFFLETFFSLQQLDIVNGLHKIFTAQHISSVVKYKAKYELILFTIILFLFIVCWIFVFPAS